MDSPGTCPVLLSWIYYNNSEYSNPVNVASVGFLKTFGTNSFKIEVVNFGQNIFFLSFDLLSFFLSLFLSFFLSFYISYFLLLSSNKLIEKKQFKKFKNSYHFDVIKSWIYIYYYFWLVFSVSKGSSAKTAEISN